MKICHVITRMIVGGAQENTLLTAKGHLLKGKTAYGCSEYKNGCQTVLPFTDYPADLTPAKLSQLIKKNFKAKQNNG